MAEMEERIAQLTAAKDAAETAAQEAEEETKVHTTACKRLSSLGCVPHTDGAVLQGRHSHKAFRLQQCAHAAPLSLRELLKTAVPSC